MLSDDAKLIFQLFHPLNKLHIHRFFRFELILKSLVLSFLPLLVELNEVAYFSNFLSSILNQNFIFFLCIDKLLMQSCILRF